jgi:hypothetical protein
VNVCLSFFIPINQLTICSAVAIAGGLYFYFVGFRLLARKRLLLAIPTCAIRGAALGLVEVTGRAAGPYTVPAPIMGAPCFLYQTTVWVQRGGKKGAWNKVADETLHLPFFVEDATGQLLIEPLGAELDLRLDFREEYHSSFLSLALDLGDVSPRIGALLARHGIVRGNSLRIEERSIKPEEALFVAGTIMENPGVTVRPHSAGSEESSEVRDHGWDREPREDASSEDLSQRTRTPKVIQLSGAAGPSLARDMSQQAKIAAALTQAGITKREAWSAAGLSSPTAAEDEEAQPGADYGEDQARPNDGRRDSSGFDLAPPVVMMKGNSDSPFAISYRSQKEFVSALAWKSSAMLWGGVAITILGVYALLAQSGLL